METFTLDYSPAPSCIGRVCMAKAAALKVIDTLTWSDHASIVLFDDTARTYSSELVAMTDAGKDAMKHWIESNIGAYGETNFDIAFQTAFNIFSSSVSLSNFLPTSSYGLSHSLGLPVPLDSGRLPRATRSSSS